FLAQPPPPVTRWGSRPAAPESGAWTCVKGLGPSADLVHPRQTAAIRRRTLTNDRAGAERQAPAPGATSPTARTVPSGRRLRRQGLVARRAPLDLAERAGGAQDVPGAVGRAEDGQISLAVAVVVAGDGSITRRAPLGLLAMPIAGAQDVPGPGARAEDGEVGLAVAVVVAGDGSVARRAPLGLLELAIARAQDVPGRVARAEDGE